MRRPSVLIVDDRVAIRRSLQDILFDFDCTFEEAGDGATALGLMAQTRFDVVFLDLRLPDLSGIEILRRARQKDLISGKVIILTGLPESTTEKEAQELGAFAYLKKSPIEWEQIRSTFTQAVPELTPPPPSVDPERAFSWRYGESGKSSKAPELAENSPKRYSILVVDDDTKWLDTIGIILEDRYALKLVSSVSEALSLAKERFFSLALLDQRLPDGSGIGLLNQLREIHPGLRAIILTGYAELKDSVKSMKVPGVVDYLSKGSKTLPEDLLNGIEAAFLEGLALAIREGEGERLEFKASARWDFRQARTNKDLEWVIVKTVTAFLNSLGGTLLIGVNDAGKALGLQQDYQTLARKDRDGYEGFLTSLLLEALDRDLAPLLHLDFPILDGNEICRISVKPSPEPTFAQDKTGDHFFIRTGNSTRELAGREVLEYCRRWKSS